jgi:hypothetical protein
MPERFNHRDVLSGKLKAVRIVEGDSEDLLMRDSGGDSQFVSQRALHAVRPQLSLTFTGCGRMLF